MAFAEKPRLSFWQLWNMSFGFLGIQFGFAIQNANTSRIFVALGANEGALPILWLAAPMTGLLMQPIVGYLSDRTWHPTFGRRRPYFLIGALCASFALIAMPNSSVLWAAAGLLWIMDASINISMEPFRAFVGDMLSPDQRNRGFAMQSFFIGTGAVIGSLMPAILTRFVGNVPASNGELPPNIIVAYYVGALIFLLAVLWTVFTTKEYPPEMIYESEEHESAISPVKLESIGSFLVIGLALVAVAAGIALWIYTAGLEKELYVLCGLFALFGICYTIVSIKSKINASKPGGFTQMVIDFHHMPKTMKQLAFVQFFTWFALFSMWIYMTPALTKYIAKITDTTSREYNDAADWVNVLFAIYNGVAALVAWGLPWFARKTNRRVTHLIALSCGGAGLIAVFFVPSAELLILPMIGIGIAWASILSMPYAMLSSSLPGSKMGYYMGVFNFFIVIPQIVAASLLGFLVNHLFSGQSIYAFLIGGVAMIVAGILTLFVDDRDEQKP